ncbi:MAG: OmpA family protein [Gammaproteobacteria bacterium]
MVHHLTRMGCLLGGLCVAAVATAAVDAQYGAGLEQSVWQVASGKHRCVLSHDIPHLGQARFTQVAGQPMKFSLVVPPEGQYAQQAVLRAIPPLWRHDRQAAVLGGQALNARRPALQLDPDTSLRLYQTLEEGMFAEVLFVDAADARLTVRVTVSAVRFRTVLKAFQTCQAGLIEPPPEPAAKKSVARAAAKVTARHPVSFAPNSFELTDGTRELLLELAREYRTGNSTQRILIAGHSDAQDAPSVAGRLAARRAQEIRGFLVRRGLPAERIQLRSTSPAESAADQADMALGATLWMIR